MINTPENQKETGSRYRRCSVLEYWIQVALKYVFERIIRWNKSQVFMNSEWACLRKKMVASPFAIFWLFILLGTIFLSFQVYILRLKPNCGHKWKIQWQPNYTKWLVIFFKKIHIFLCIINESQSLCRIINRGHSGKNMCPLMNVCDTQINKSKLI